MSDAVVMTPAERRRVMNALRAIEPPSPKRYGVRVVVGADIGHPIEGWAKGGKNLTHETAVALADGLRDRGYTAFVKPYS